MGTNWSTYVALLRFHTVKLAVQSVDTLPAAACGLLGSLLPPLDSLAPLRTRLAGRLRGICDQAAWYSQAELGEICAVLDGLHALSPGLVSGADLAAFIQRLLGSEIAPGGPYREVDGMLHASTNAFVNQTLHWVAEPLPNVSGFLAQADRLFASAKLTDAEKLLLHALSSHGPAQTKHMLELQTHGQLLTAALAAQIVYQAEQGTGSDDAFATHLRTVYAYSRPHSSHPEPFAGKTHGMLRRVVRADANHEIAALAWMYGHACRPAQLNAAVYEHFGVANVYAWTAYTIYDDFLDEEGDPSLLATANHCLRAMLREYHDALPESGGFQAFVEETLATVDVANTYETTSLRFAVTADAITIGSLPDYGAADLLAERALFHIIGPMGVLAAGGEPVGSSTWTGSLTAFRHYLIARQLNDDIHDWVKDLQRGQVSYVVAALLRYLGTTPGTYHLGELLGHARPIFWQNVLPDLCDTALEHIALAKQMPAVDRTAFENSQLMQLFDYVESSMHAAKRQRDTSHDFINALRL
ncbi:MAG TPA: hypothetical protein VLF40_01935 [Candidatus Saccharimonadales bacterium]|nr:hypothetical protein [Candidatus Saccharimonadales bacterium]